VAIGLAKGISSESSTVARPTVRAVATIPTTIGSLVTLAFLLLHTKTLPLDWLVANPCTASRTLKLTPKILCYGKWRNCYTATQLQMGKK